MRPAISPIEIVNKMLIADKLQNYKDFIFNRDKHITNSPEREWLDEYFDKWFFELKLGFIDIYNFTKITNKVFGREVHDLG